MSPLDTNTATPLGLPTQLLPSGYQFLDHHKPAHRYTHSFFWTNKDPMRRSWPWSSAKRTLFIILYFNKADRSPQALFQNREAPSTTNSNTIKLHDINEKGHRVPRKTSLGVSKPIGLVQTNRTNHSTPVHHLQGPQPPNTLQHHNNKNPSQISSISVISKWSA